MEKRDRKPGYFARLKRRRQLKQSQLEKTANERGAAVIACPELPKDSEANKKASLPRTTTAKTAAGSADGCKSNNPAKREKRRPPGTVEFIAGPNDSLNSIALNFNVTPNKLVQLNKLFCHSVYPGQKLFVPDVSRTEFKSQTDSDPALTNGPAVETTQDGSPNRRSARSIRRQLSPNSEDDGPATVKFIKMSCKYFTDGMGVVGGVLIVTPNNIMFDPHKSDPLVIEHGCEEYGLICPMEEVVSVALYDDVSRMKLKDALPSDLPRDLCPVYRPGEWEQLPSERDLNPFSRYEAPDAKRPVILDDLESALSETVSTEGEQTDKSPSDEGFTELEPTVNGSAEEAEGTSSKTPDGARRPRGEGDARDKSALCPTEGKPDDDEDEGLARNSSVEDGESVRSSSETAGLREEATSKEETSGVAELRKRETATPDGWRQSYDAEVKSWLMERIQAPIQDMLFSSEEKSRNPPMFLCFRVGKPMRKSFASGMTSSPAHSFGSVGKQPEYWFAVPQERVDHLYAFFVQWSPDVYGKEAREQGFVVVEKDELDMIDNFFGDPASCSWEIITIDEAKRRQSFGSCDGEPAADGLPILSDGSDLLQDTHVEKLACRLPARVQGYPWRLAYSTVKHGTSLKTLYRNLLDVDAPVLLVVKDLDRQIFGAFSTHPFKISEHCYGTGETFLYSFCPEIKVYRWTGDNSYFVKGNIDSLQMGGGGGQLGLWLDAELYRGTTTRCATFDNRPLSGRQDFNIHSLEVWTFE
ncbi:nuclear receptor coactivator 7 isoform X1 [Phyllopteryx taeniolatus]|uniref:nuclear receptor coactivator 7 isoform X1 n=1 Tax=Phyllopteryx taeniolatus TaxID=161469 RepID=UPI002AD1FEF7|nr:nuclear receptor coactivator 7 isoform X1 [Phyllopteryx taeniolatus]XP_061610490.1 nuclear receptor coactivator 7 isoform X1 [Phyllopteryx taeniolatus]XP_061610491.1 nuclear receptor coactivator 7 isoform X1 [Phyllopteryx taeniolatus]XP_061610492.1 nuclear receptor coactivator 7 isoform X1 [Phyllopteryx taeniolatus]XP_061610493.1 nuclear receptor coactivator 7 isoform X1 [Phyllopteryx taeniolatus]XP_061610494.1 nuclear receptor coactivator 7 isoform X1 [Phyllopteryx taeniolatus]